MNKPDISKCGRFQRLDSAATTSRLIGTWKWSQQFCWWGGKGVTDADKNIKVRFNTNYSFFVVENNKVLTNGTWEIVPVNGKYWGLKPTSYSDYLAGYILFCDGFVSFNDSYRDGCDNLFYKDN